MSGRVSTNQLLAALRAAGEPTRLRLLALLSRGELNVKDLTRILGQSQPRISRHLKLLTEAGLIERFREGSWVFFRLIGSGPASTLIRQVLQQLDVNDPVIARDIKRADAVKAERAQKAQAYFRKHAAEWDRIRTLHIAEEQVERAMRQVLGSEKIHTLVDIGTGTGRILELFAEQFTHGLGIDINTDMLAYARAKLEQAGIKHAQVRQADLYHLPLDNAIADAVIIHQVLHFLDNPAQALNECARIIAPGGRLLIVDFKAHELEILRDQFAHQRLGFETEQMRAWTAESGLDLERHIELQPNGGQPEKELSVMLWLARKKAAHPADHLNTISKRNNWEDAA